MKKQKTKKYTFKCEIEEFEKTKEYKEFEKKFKNKKIKLPKKVQKKAIKLENYIPAQDSPVKIICINFHVFQDNAGLNNWSFQQIPEIKRLLDWVNGVFTNVALPSDPIAANGIVPINDTRIRFKLNKIEFYRDSSLYNSTNVNALFNAISARSVNFLKHLNIFLINGGASSSGGFATLPSANMNKDSYIVMKNTHRNSPNSDFAVALNIAHELGHVLGLCHTYLGGGCSPNCNQSHPDFLYDVFGNNPSTCPHFANWAADPHDNTVPNAEKFTNNLMGGTHNNLWTSALQAAKMHRALETLSVSKYLVNNCDCLCSSKCIFQGGTSPKNWKDYDKKKGMYIDVDTSMYNFKSTPHYLATLEGSTGHWMTTGVTSIYNPTNKGFRVYVRFSDSRRILQKYKDNWYIKWTAIGDV